MAGLDDRERAFEDKMKHDAELAFRITARRNKLLGLWAAAQLGLTDDEAAAYAKTVVIADMEEAGDEDVIRKVVADLARGGIGIGPDAVRAEILTQAAEAKRQIAAG
jgi:hypothetical protein